MFFKTWNELPKPRDGILRFARFRYGTIGWLPLSLTSAEQELKDDTK